MNQAGRHVQKAEKSTVQRLIPKAQLLFLLPPLVEILFATHASACPQVRVCRRRVLVKNPPALIDAQLSQKRKTLCIFSPFKFCQRCLREREKERLLLAKASKTHSAVLRAVSNGSGCRNFAALAKVGARVFTHGLGKKAL